MFLIPLAIKKSFNCCSTVAVGTVTNKLSLTVPVAVTVPFPPGVEANTYLEPFRKETGTLLAKVSIFEHFALRFVKTKSNKS